VILQIVEVNGTRTISLLWELGESQDIFPRARDCMTPVKLYLWNRITGDRMDPDLLTSCYRAVMGFTYL
jgi:hypothetical protein